MNKSSKHARSLVTCATMLLAVLINGCGKKQSAASLPENPPTNSAPSADQAAAPAANRSTPAATSADAAAALAAAQAAMQSKDYEKAAATLLAVQRQRQPLTPEQGQAVRDQMVLLQQNLAAGVASGDPKAKAAADLLRKSTMR